jgi:hypothetical protein
MHGYVDPFAHRSAARAARKEGEHADGEGESKPVADEEVDDLEHVGLDAIADDLDHGRREAPFADDPRHRVRPASE